MMNRIVGAFRKGQRVCVELRIKRSSYRWQRITGCVVGEYKNFILLQGPYYKECLDKDAFQVGSAKLLNVTVTERGAA